MKAFFNGIRDGLLETNNGQLLEEKETNRFASPGRYIKTKFGNGYINRVQCYLIRNRLYLVSIVLREKDADAKTLKFHEEIAAKFFNSFKPKIDESGLSRPFSIWMHDDRFMVSGFLESRRNERGLVLASTIGYSLPH